MVIKFGGLPSKCISTGYKLTDWSSTVCFRVIINGDRLTVDVFEVELHPWS